MMNYNLIQNAVDRITLDSIGPFKCQISIGQNKSEDDYELQLSLIGLDESTMKELTTLYKKSCEVSIKSEQIDRLSLPITKIVITAINADNIGNLVFTALSDEPIDLIIKE